MKKLYTLIVFSILFIINALAQTGPGGVSTTTGSGNLKLWLKGDSVTIDGGSGLMTLKDLSGYGFDFTQSDLNYQPAVSAINGFGALDFQNVTDGLGDYLINADLKSQLNGQSAFTILFVIKSDVTNTDNGFFTTLAPSGSDAPFSIRYDTEGINGLASDVITASTGVPGIIESSASSQVANNQLVKFKWITNSTPQLFLDGASNTLSYGNPYTGSITGADITYLGKGTQDDNADEGWDGLIAEVIFFNRQLNSAEQNIVENYLATRYALTISNDLFSNPIDFKYDAVGIGMESNGKHSGSVSAGFGVYEDNSSLGNGEYVFVSHKNTTNDAGSIQSGANVNDDSDATHAWARDWYLEKTGDVDLRVYFDFSDAFENGGVPQNISNYRLLHKSTEGGNYTTVTTSSQGIQAGDQVYFEVENANIANGYYTLGTTDQTNSPLQGSNTQTWYTLVGGDWTDPSIWTLDPSGALPLNPANEYPDEFDNVYILSGRTVTISGNGIQTKMLTVTGRLELGTTTLHDFTEIRGEGRIVLEGDNFPGGDATHFVSEGQGEGTVLYTGAGRSLTTPYTFYNLEVELNNDADVLALVADYTLNGYLNIKKGKFKINDDLVTSTTSIQLTIKGDATVSAGTEFIVGTGNAIHNIEFQGNVTNNGIIDFSNAAQYDCPANGAVRTDFTGAADNTLICNGRTDLYRLIVNKGTDETYTLSVLSTDAANFALYGPIGGGDCIDPADGPEGWERLAMVIQKGTLKLGSNINIPRLAANRTGTVSNEFLIPAGSRLWIDGATVSTHEDAGGWRGLTLYGTLQVSAGSFTNPTGTGGITYYGNLASPGKIVLTGGAIYTTQLKQDDPNGRISYIQSGGSLYINNLSDSRGSSAVFGLANAEHTFEMSGGLIQISSVNTTATNGIHILCDEGNYNVTGGTFEILLPTLDAGAEPQFEINSTIPFYNLTLTESAEAGTQELVLQTELVVLNNLTIGANTTLNTAGNTVSVGGNFELEDGGTYTHGNNTTKFISSKNSAIIVGNTADTAPLQFYDFEIEKDLQSNPALFWDVEVQSPGRTAGTVPLSINNNFTITRGSFNTGEFDIQMNGVAMEIVDGTIANSTGGSIVLTDIGTQHTLKSAYGATNQSFGHIDMTNATQGAKLLSNIKVTDITLSAANTLFYLDVYNLEVTNSINGWSDTKYFRTAGNGSDGGLTLHFTLSGTENGVVATFPIGSPAGYTPGEILIDDYTFGADVTGWVKINPVNDYHPATRNLANTLQYYWISEQSGFEAVPAAEVYYRFYYINNVPSNFREHILYDYLWVDAVSSETGNVLQYNVTTIGIVDAEFACGQNSEFNRPRLLYSRKNGSWFDITAGNPMWEEEDGTLITQVNRLPDRMDIVVVRNGHRVNAFNSSVNVAKLVFSHDTTGASGFEDVPRVQVSGNNTFTFNKVEGTGMFTQLWGPANQPTVNGDFGSFANEPYSWFLYIADGAGNITLPTTYSVFPNLGIEDYDVAGVNMVFSQNVTVNYDLLVQGNATLRLNNGANGNIYIARDLYIGNYYDGAIQFPTSGSKRTLTIIGDIDFTMDFPEGFPASNARQITVLNTTPSTLRHDLNLGGSIIQDAGVIDLYNGVGATANHAVLKLIGQNNGTFTRSGAGATDLYRIEMFKTPGKSFTFNNTFTLNGPTDTYPKALELLSGDFIIDAAGQDLTLSSGGALFRIPSTSSLAVGGISGDPAILRVTGNNTGIYLDGKLTLNDYSQALFNGGVNNYIEYSSSGYAQIDINNAELRVGSQIRRPTTTDQGILKFNQLDANSTVVLGEVDAPTSNRGVLEILNDTSTFTQVENANITIVRGQTSASVAALLLNPTIMELRSGSSITFGNASLTSASQIGINSTKNLQNIIVNSTNATARMMVRALNIDEDFTIINGTFDANGLALNIKGNFSNSSLFDANDNTTTFNGSLAQSITGVTTFYNLTKSTSNTLALNSAITVENDLNIQSGTLSDNGNTLNLQGDLTMDGTHSYGSAGFGINMSAVEEQRISGTGNIGYLTIANPYLVRVLIGTNVTITNGLNMNGGIFDVGQNLVVLTKDADVIEGSPYSNTNMIRTNASFTDNGVRKYFKSTAESGGPYTLTLPIGSGTKYTPIIFNVTANGNSTGFITSKAADEYHPSIIEDAESTEIVDSLNVLWYHWVLKSSGISGFSGTVYMKYDPSDIYVTPPYTVDDYIAARILNDGSGLWNKYDADDFDEANERMIFYFPNVGSDEIFGDYTAGVDSAIPDQVPFYETVSDGNWNDGSIWDPYVAGGPRGAMVRINTGHTVILPSNGVSSYTTTINGQLNVNLTYAHRLGNVDGTGTLYMQRPSLPAGDYDRFFSAFGGTLEYGGSNDYDVMASYPVVNNLKFSGTGKRRLPTQNILMYGDFIMDGDDATLQIINDHNKKITVMGDVTFNSGLFDAGNTADAEFEMAGAVPQTITGSFTGTSRDFNHFVMNNSTGITVNDDIDIYGNLEFVDGIITVTSPSTLSMTYFTNSIINAGSDKFVDGILRKSLGAGSSFNFPVGDDGRYAPTVLSNTQPSGTYFWEVEYFDSNPIDHPVPLPPANKEATLQLVSEYEYWRVNGPANGESPLQIRWDQYSLLPAMTSDRETNLRMVEWSTTNSQWEIVTPYTISDGGVNSGTVTSDNSLSLDNDHFFTLGTTEGTPLPAAGFITQDTTICSGSSFNLRIMLTGTQPWSIKVHDSVSGTENEYTGITASPFEIPVSPGADITYTITEIADNTTGYITTTIYGDPVNVTVAPLATVPSTFSDERCGVGIVNLSASGALATENYRWYISDVEPYPFLSDVDELDIFLNNTTTYYVSMYNTGGCESIRVPVTGTIHPIPAFTPSATPATICFGEFSQLDAEYIETGATTYLWSPVGAELVTENIANPIFTPATNPTSPVQVTVTYTVKVTDENTCFDTETVNIVVNRRPETGPQYHISNDFGN